MPEKDVVSEEAGECQIDGLVELQTRGILSEPVD